MSAPGGEVATDAPVRVAVCISHPVVYFCALYATLATDPRLVLQVLFAVREGAVPYHDAEFAALVDPGLGPLLARVPHRFCSDAPTLAAERRVPRRAVWDALTAHDPAVVVIYGFNRRISRLAWVWARRHRRRVVLITDSEDRGVRTTPAPVGLVKRLLARVVLRRMDRIFTVGDANEAFHRRRGVPAARLARVPFPIDREAFSDPDGRARARAAALRVELGLTDVAVVLSSGKLVPRKRQGDLVAALAGLPAPDRAALLLLGTGPDQDRLVAAATRRGVRLVLPGFVAPRELLPWYLLADVYAHVSDFDPHPLAVSEAVHCGLPVVVSDRIGSWGPTDDVIPGVNGLVVPTGDVPALTAALADLIGDDARRAALGAASRARGAVLQDAARTAYADELVTLARGGRGPSRR